MHYHVIIFITFVRGKIESRTQLLCVRRSTGSSEKFQSFGLFITTHEIAFYDPINHPLEIPDLRYINIFPRDRCSKNAAYDGCDRLIGLMNSIGTRNTMRELCLLRELLFPNCSRRAFPMPRFISHTRSNSNRLRKNSASWLRFSRHGKRNKRTHVNLIRADRERLEQNFSRKGCTIRRQEFLDSWIAVLQWCSNFKLIFIQNRPISTFDFLAYYINAS